MTSAEPHHPTPPAPHQATLLQKPFLSSPNNERSCLGHRETIFGVAFSPDSKYLASASQDSTVRIWEVASNRLVQTLNEGMDVNYECLRVAWMPLREDSYYLLASAGADGIVRLWSASRHTSQWKLVGMKDHSSSSQDRPQVYSLQFIRNDLLMTSADDTVHLWNIQQTTLEEKEITPLSSIQFSHLDESHRFGGVRNPGNEIYVFDAAHNNDLIAVALSDGTCRVVTLANGNPCERCVLRLPSEFLGEKGGHLTALSWDASGSRLATCIASGKVVLWSIRVEGCEIYPSIVAVLEGGHDVQRPLFGTRYYSGKNEELLLTWGVDGKVCAWDSYSRGVVTSPLCTLISHSSYPIYALDFTKCKSTSGSRDGCLAIGGGSDGGFLGVPVYLYDI